MKLARVLLALLAHHCLLPLFSTGSSSSTVGLFMGVAQQEEDVEIGADGSTTTGHQGPNCDEVCSSKVSAVLQDMDKLKGEMLADFEQKLARVQEEKNEIVAASEAKLQSVEEERKQLLSKKQECDNEAAYFSDKLKEAELKISQTQAALQRANQQSQELASDLFSAKQEISDFQQRKIFINAKAIKEGVIGAAKNIKEEISSLLKKYNTNRIAAE